MNYDHIKIEISEKLRVLLLENVFIYWFQLRQMTNDHEIDGNLKNTCENIESLLQ